jgi:prevent-host-death family protein
LIASFVAMQPTAPDRRDALRMVNVHQAKTQLSRLMDAAHAGETIVLAKAGKPWARLVPLASPPPQRVPGRLRSQGPLSEPNALLEPLEADDLAAWDEGALLSSPPQP